jgi:hypothetical protein
MVSWGIYIGIAPPIPLRNYLALGDLSLKSIKPGFRFVYMRILNTNLMNRKIMLQSPYLVLIVVRTWSCQERSINERSY